jgi:hypothetical protein
MYNELDFRTLRTLLGGVTIWRCMCGNTTGIAEAADGRGPSVCIRKRSSAYATPRAAIGVESRQSSALAETTRPSA